MQRGVSHKSYKKASIKAHLLLQGLSLTVLIYSTVSQFDLHICQQNQIILCFHFFLIFQVWEDTAQYDAPGAGARVHFREAHY